MKWWRNINSCVIIVSNKISTCVNILCLTLNKMYFRRTTNDKYSKVKEYLNEFAAKDIPVDVDTDDISAIVVRYLLFVERMGLTAEQRMIGLDEIFLCDAVKNSKTS